MRQQTSQLITTLQQQVEALTPLRQSHAKLQAYYANMLDEYQQLTTFGVWLLSLRMHKKRSF